MCFHFIPPSSTEEIENYFHAKPPRGTVPFAPVMNAFLHPVAPIIKNDNPTEVAFYQWGLIPFWAKDDSIKKYTLNARLETIHSKPSFRNVVKNRCILPAKGFFEWQWLDEKGKKKQKYQLTIANQPIMGLAGLWSDWIDPQTGEWIGTFTLLTMKANELMEKIHNHKKRMPLIIDAENTNNWLHDRPYEIQNDQLQATKVS